MILFGDTLMIDKPQIVRLKLGLPPANSFGFSPITIPFLISGGGSVISTGMKGWLRIPGNITLSKWELFADQSGDIEIDVLKSSYANLPSFASIAGSDLPTLSAAQKNQSSALTGWNRSLQTGDWISFVVNSAATVKLATVVLVGNRTS